MPRRPRLDQFESGPFRRRIQVTRRGGSWQAAFTGAAQQMQRRAFPRVPLGTPMTLTRSNRTYEGVLVDLSDVALSARSDADHTPAMREGDHVHVSLAPGESGSMFRGGVVRERVAR